MNAPDQPALDPLLDAAGTEQMFDPDSEFWFGGEEQQPQGDWTEGPGAVQGAVVGPAPVAAPPTAQSAYDPLHPEFHDPYYDAAEWTRLRRRSPLTLRLGVVFGVLVLLGAFTFRTGKGWLDNRLDPPGPPGQALEVEIPSGATSDDIARILAGDGVVPSSLVTSYYWRFKDAPEFQAGSYIFRENMSVNEAREVLEAGPQAAVFGGERILIPEGLWLDEVEDRFLDELPSFDPFQLAAALRGGEIRSRYQPADSNDLEGMLFPAVYEVPEEELSDERALVQQMVNQFDIRAGVVGLANAPELVGVSPYEAIIIASLIEEEAKFDEERGKIARVIYNRLRDGERLQIDATVIRAIGYYPEDGVVLESDLETLSPYNTYVVDGLPPTPISSPGQASLAAALSPEAGDWKFYVVIDEEGHHAFANTFEEHQANIALAEAAGVR